MPPGGFGTTTVMALLGKVCACAASDTDAQAAAISSRFIRFPPVDCAGRSAAGTLFGKRWQKR
jgi:hypothetical protein